MPIWAIYLLSKRLKPFLFTTTSKSMFKRLKSLLNGLKSNCGIGGSRTLRAKAMATNALPYIPCEVFTEPQNCPCWILSTSDYLPLKWKVVTT